MEALGINIGYLIVQIIAFIVIYTLMTRFIYNPLLNGLRSRRERIAKGLEDARAAANARLNAEAEAEKVIAQARVEVQQNIEQGRVRGGELAKQIEADARSQAEKILTDARANAEQMRDSELAGLRGQVAAIAIAAAQRLIGESLDEKRQRALVDEFFTKVPTSARSLGGSVEVISAMPLNEAEQSRVRQETGAAEAKFTVDPNILGGLIIRSGDRVVDGSVRSSLNELAGRLN